MCKYVTISHTKSYSTIDRIFSGLLPANALSSYCLTFIMLSLLQRQWHDMQTLLLVNMLSTLTTGTITIWMKKQASI